MCMKLSMPFLMLDTHSFTARLLGGKTVDIAATFFLLVHFQLLKWLTEVLRFIDKLPSTMAKNEDVGN